MSEQLVLGIIGLGVGRKYALAAREKGLKLALCDVDEGKLREAGREFEAQAVTADWRELITWPEVTAVVVASPDPWHRPMVLEGLRHGKCVLCETPLDVRRAGAELVLDTCLDTGLHVLVAHRYRFHPLANRFREALPRIGTIGLVEGRWVRPASSLPKGWRLDPESRKSLALGEAVDMVDLLRYLGGEVFEVTGFATRNFCPDWPFADTLTVSGRMGSRAALHLLLSVSPQWPRTTWLAIHGENGSLELDLEEGWFRFRDDQGRESLELGPVRDPLEPERSILDAFLALLEDGRRNPCSAEEAAGTVATAVSILDATAVNLPSRIRPVLRD